MPAYVDTSALVKRYVVEVGSAWVRRLLAHPAQYVIYTSALSQVEVISALQRRVREGSLAEAQAQRLAYRVTVHFAQRYQVVALTQVIVDQACVGLQTHPLRAADAVHLACALTIRRITQEQGLPPPSFVVADTALRAAATAEGFVVDDPLQHP
jgi:predicted nucleic acid-binding protein